MHKISVPDYVTERIIARRGKLTIFDRVVAKTTALLVIDLQNAFLNSEMPSYVPGSRELVPNVNRLAQALRNAGGTVVWIKHTADPSWDVYDLFSKPERGAAANASFTPGNIGHELHDSLQTDARDMILEKRRFSALIQGSSDLDARLRQAGIDTVIITGVVSNSCCECTARDAMMLNYKMIFVSDANGARTDDEHNATLGNIMRLFGDVATTDDVISRFV